MSNTLLDFSKTDELKPLARLVSRIRAATKDRIPFLIAGAQARDLLLKHAHGIETGRQTADVDFAFRVATWEEFLELRKSLVEGGDFTEVRGKLHKLLFAHHLEVDILPFGALEADDRTIAWPPDGDVVMSTFGFREALESWVEVTLPESESVRIVSLQALALLKLEAWRERRLRVPGKDAHDIRLILTMYLHAGNHERLFGEFSRLLDDPQFEFAEAGAYILGSDISRLLDKEGRERILVLVSKESDPEGALHLVGDMRLEPVRALALLAAVRRGLGT